MTAAGVLVVGYGNSLRGDDGVGWPPPPGSRAPGSWPATQLVPELAEDVSRASLSGAGATR